MIVTNIRGAVLNRFKSYTEFAEVLGWPKQRLSKIITGKKIPNVNEIAEMADGLDMTINGVAEFFLTSKSPNEQHNEGK